MTEAQKELLFKLTEVVMELVPHQHDDTSQGDNARKVVSALAELASAVELEGKAAKVETKVAFHSGGIVTRNGLGVGAWGFDGTFYWFTSNIDGSTYRARRRSQLVPAVVAS
jgi:hypothetical protein